MGRSSPHPGPFRWRRNGAGHDPVRGARRVLSACARRHDLVLATPPGTRRVLIYLGGAETSTVASGRRSWPGQTLNILLVDLTVLDTVEIPLLLHLVLPEASTRVVVRLDDLARRYAWRLGTLTAGGGGIYLIVRGSLELAA